jgi:hypothetical protein
MDMRTVRILITDDRHWRCDALAEQILNRLLARYGPDLTIVHGGVRCVPPAGLPKMAHQYGVPLLANA